MKMTIREIENSAECAGSENAALYGRHRWSLSDWEAANEEWHLLCKINSAGPYGRKPYSRPWGNVFVREGRL